MRNDSEIKIFPGSASVEFTKRICGYLNISEGESTVLKFSDGNTYVKIGEKVRGKDIYIVQTIGLDPNNEFMELLFWVDAFRRSVANSITVIMPYFGYAKADKKDEPRVSIRARVCADCLETAGVDRVVTMDLHSAQIQGFFKKPVDHLYAANLFCDYIRGMNITDYVIVSPDEGFAKNARYYSNKLNVPLVIGSKQRTSHNEKAEIMGLMGYVEGKHAIIVDDFTISCGTLTEIANVVKNRGALSVHAFVSHALLSKKGVAALRESPIEKLVATDTVHNPNIGGCEKVTVLSVADMFAKAIRIIHNKESLHELFD
ncbi:MAG: ribose-phosphate diphosphokinase [Defluviitaleaceae bacterium]|nr:ribose-phosphate diphosphokinase [Defluviitaleaceae bacterium]